MSEEDEKHATWPDVAIGCLHILAVTWPYVLATIAFVVMTVMR